MQTWAVLIVLFLIALPVGVIAYAVVFFRGRSKQRKNPDSYLDADLPPVNTRAELLELRTTDGCMPEAVFLLAQGERINLLLDLDIAETLQLGMQGVLTMQDGYFIGFEPD